MGIEVIFFAILIIFAVTGLVHGYRQELGVTVVLLLGVCLLEITEANFKTQFNNLLYFAIPNGAIYREAVRGLFYCLFLLFLVFLAYQTDFLRFPGAHNSTLLNITSGALNGYLLAGSLWYYLAQAGWPFVHQVSSYSSIYLVAWQALPPNVFAWPFLLILAMMLMVVRVVRVGAEAIR